MIERVEIKNPNRTPVKWWPKVKQLRRFPEFHFEEGINIIWGPNGSGKSTLLAAMAHVAHCKQGGHSVLTHTSLQVLEDLHRDGLQDGMHLYCDGQGVLYYSPLDSVGLVGGMAGFDDDFFSEGMESIGHTHISSGQSAQAKLHQVMQHKGEPVDWKYTFKEDRHPKAYAFMREQLSARCEKGPQTILMDEPDAHLDWPNKLKFWATMREVDKFQLIIATHSPFALRLPSDVHFIELEEDYRLTCEAALRMGGLWSGEKEKAK